MGFLKYGDDDIVRNQNPLILGTAYNTIENLISLDNLSAPDLSRTMMNIFDNQLEDRFALDGIFNQYLTSPGILNATNFNFNFSFGVSTLYTVDFMQRVINGITQYYVRLQPGVARFSNTDFSNAGNIIVNKPRVKLGERQLAKALGINTQDGSEYVKINYSWIDKKYKMKVQKINPDLTVTTVYLPGSVTTDAGLIANDGVGYNTSVDMIEALCSSSVGGYLNLLSGGIPRADLITIEPIFYIPVVGTYNLRIGTDGSFKCDTSAVGSDLALWTLVITTGTPWSVSASTADMRVLYGLNTSYISKINIKPNGVTPTNLTNIADIYVDGTIVNSGSIITQAGAALIGSTDIAGGSLTFNTGTSTGTGGSTLNSIKFQSASTGTTGTTLRAVTQRLILSGASTTDYTSAILGTAVTGNTFKVAGTTSGTINYTTDVTTGTVNLFTSITSGIVNLATGGNSNINIGGSGGATITIGLTSGTTILVNGTGVTTTNLFNTVSTTLNIGGAATTIAIGATTGTMTLSNPAIIGTQTTQNLFNTVSTTLNIGGVAATIAIGATTGIMTLQNPTIIGTQTTQNLFNTVATTLNIGGIAATIAIGATTGTMTLANPTIIGTQTTQNLFNTVSTTLNIGGAATTLSLGAATGTASFNNITFNHPNATTFNFTTTGLSFISTTGTSTVNLFNGANTTTLNIGGAAASIAIGATTGTMTLSNPAIIGTQTTQNLFNTVATTLNIGGAATTLTIGGTPTTSSPTFNIATNQTDNTHTKTINIGTGGVSGSTTNIVIGPSAAVATSTVTIYGNLQTGNLVTVSASGTINLTASNFGVVLIATTASATVNLPAKSTIATGYDYYIKNRSTGTITVQVYSGDGSILDGSTSIVLNPYESIITIYDGTYWDII